MNNKKWIIPFVSVLLIFLVAPTALAHVTVHPEESSTDAWEKYSVRVPVEKDINTTKVELKIPDEVDFVNVLPEDNWDYELEKDENGIVTSVIWEATDDGIGPNEFAEFYFVGSNPSEAGKVSWEAYQTYEDDSVVEWVGEPDAEEPASVTEVVDGDTAAQHGDDTTGTSETATEDSEESSDSSESNSWLPISLSAVAILLALISLFRKRG